MNVNNDNHFERSILIALDKASVYKIAADVAMISEIIQVWYKFNLSRNHNATGAC